MKVKPGSYLEKERSRKRKPGTKALIWNESSIVVERQEVSVQRE